MKQNPEVAKRIEALAAKGGRYRREAWFFVARSLSFANREVRGQARHQHLNAADLLEGFRQLARQEYGPLALDVLNFWGLRSTRDVGEIVFAMVRAGILASRREDVLADFDDAYDFHREFLEPPAPAGPATATDSKATRYIA